MQYEVIDDVTEEVMAVFEEEHLAWKWIKEQGDHAGRYDVLYAEVEEEYEDEC